MPVFGQYTLCMALLLPAIWVLQTVFGVAPYVSTQNPTRMAPPDTFESVTSADGTTISYLKRGSGPPVLFVHGTAADHRSWTAIAPYLEEHITLYAMDRRGRGASGDAPDYALLRESEDIAAVVEAIGGGVTIFGHSFGGLCVLEAARLADGIHRLILYEPALPGSSEPIEPHIIEQIRSLVAAGELEAAMERMILDVGQVPEHEFEAYRSTPLWEARIPIAATIPRELSIEQTYTFDRASFSRLRVPTLLLVGGDSPEVYQAAIDTLAQTLPQNQVVTLRGQQHLAHHTSPALLAEAVLRFLKE